MWAAAGLGAVFVCVVGWYLIGGLRPLAQAEEPEPVTAHSGSVGDLALGSPPQIAGAGAGRFDLMDRHDPRRRAGELSFASMDPLPGHRFTLSKPAAWLYTRGGQTIHVRGDAGDIYRPDEEKEPEAGTITGDVVVDVYAPRRDGAKINPAVDMPAVTLKAPRLAFDTQLATLTTDDPFTVESPEMFMAGTGLHAVLNQVRERLESLSIKEGDRLVIRQGAGKNQAAATSAAPEPAPGKPAATGPGGSAQAAASATGPAAAPPASKKAAEVLYHALFEQNVVVFQEGRTLEAEQLDLWGRTIDNKLPEGAIARFKPLSPPSGQQSGGAHVEAEPAAPPAAGPGTPAAPAAAAPGAPGELVLRWSGPCTVTPLPEAPPQLKDDHVALRFVAPKTGTVVFRDLDQDAAGHAAAIEYGATTRRLLLQGGPDSPASMAMGDGRALEAPRVEADAGTGLIHIPSAGVLTDEAGRDARLEWGTQADLTFQVRDGTVTNMLKQATFDGGFKATQREGSLTGGFARADFVPGADEKPSLSRLIVDGKAVADSAASEHLEADHLDIGFAPAAGGRTVIARSLTASGNAKAETKSTHLTADQIEAQLEEGVPGRAEVASATARGTVRYADDDEHVTAEADDMRLDHGRDSRVGGPDGRRRIVDMTGKNVVLSLKDQTTISGTQMRVNGLTERLEVFGPGLFDHTDPGKAVVHAAWTGGMSFDNTAGLVDCYGDAGVINTPDPWTRDHIEAERIKLELMGSSEAKSLGLEQGSDRRLLRALAYGSVLDRDGGINAKITSERFTADSAATDGKRLIQMDYLEGPTIIADNDAQTLDVPSAGRLMVVDRRPDSKSAPATSADQPAGPTGSKGDALFDWEGTFHADRAKGEMQMRRGVQMTHRALKDHAITNLNCDMLSASTRPGNERGGLESATATGAVYATSGPEAQPGQPRPLRKELVADTVHYDAATRVMDAAANRGGIVTFFDPLRGTPGSAEAVRWDLNSDRIDVTHPGPIVGPR
jgi:lipopolysaccharide export system protein LptA